MVAQKALRMYYLLENDVDVVKNCISKSNYIIHPNASVRIISRATILYIYLGIDIQPSFASWQQDFPDFYFNVFSDVLCGHCSSLVRVLPGPGRGAHGRARGARPSQATTANFIVNLNKL